MSKIKTTYNVAIAAIALAVVVAFAGCPQPEEQDKPGDPEAQTRAITLTISREGLSLLSLSLTLTEGETYSGNLIWLESFQDNLDGLTASVSGDKRAFTDSEKETSLGISIKPQSGCDISPDDLDILAGLLDAIGDELAELNISFSHNCAAISPVEYEQALVSLTITVTGAGTQPAAMGNIPLRNSATAEASFTWIADYQNYTVPSHLRTYSANVTGETEPFTGSHTPTLQIEFKAPNGAEVELSATDEASLRAAVQAALNAHFVTGNKPATETVRGTGVINPAKNGGQNYQNDLSADPALTISFGGLTGELQPGTTNVVIKNYADPANIAGFTIPDGAFKTAIAGKDISVDIQGLAGNTVSLAYVHHLRQALQSAKSVSINSTLTPVFDGRDWWTHGGSPFGTLNKNLYDTYPENADTTLMEDIRVSKDPTDNKYVVVYDRDLKVSRPVWQNNTDSVDVPFHGFGLIKGTGGNILPLNAGKNAVFGGSTNEENNIDYCATVPNFTAYDTALREAGLHPSQNDASGNPVRLDHSRVRVNGAPSTNVMDNGVYDFVLGYYNPAPTGTPDNTYTALLPNWTGFSGMTFDGYAKDGGGYIMNGGKYTPALPGAVASRNIGGSVYASPDRKAASAGGGYQKDEPRSDFIGSITYNMAKYMVENLGINEFHNTNIIGDYVNWTGYKLFENVALVGGDYSKISGDVLYIKTQGVIDIKGQLPKQIMDSSTEAKYLNIWSNVSRETNVHRFPVVAIRGAGGEFITTGNYLATDAEAKVIIYHNKYTGTPPSNGDIQPNHRAFVVNGTPKITGGSIPSSNASWYQGTEPANPIPSLDESAWIEYANGGTLPTNLATSYTTLPTEYKITQEEFDGLQNNE